MYCWSAVVLSVWPWGQTLQQCFQFARTVHYADNTMLHKKKCWRCLPHVPWRGAKIAQPLLHFARLAILQQRPAPSRTSIERVAKGTQNMQRQPGLPLLTPICLGLGNGDAAAHTRRLGCPWWCCCPLECAKWHGSDTTGHVSTPLIAVHLSIRQPSIVTARRLARPRVSYRCVLTTDVHYICHHRMARRRVGRLEQNPFGKLSVHFFFLDFLFPPFCTLPGCRKGHSEGPQELIDVDYVAPASGGPHWIEAEDQIKIVSRVSVTVSILVERGT